LAVIVTGCAISASADRHFTTDPVARLANNSYANSKEITMPDKRLSFKEMCTQFDVTPRTLRYYEYIELLTPEKEGRSRFYAAKELARMTLILRGRRFGFSLEDIRQWLMIYENEGTQAQMREWISMADRQMIELTEQREQLDETMAELSALREATAKTLG
jgi:DNA-binding transcriptional MerR regulator